MKVFALLLIVVLLSISQLDAADLRRDDKVYAFVFSMIINGAKYNKKKFNH